LAHGQNVLKIHSCSSYADFVLPDPSSFHLLLGATSIRQFSCYTDHMGINDKLNLKPQRGLEVTALLILVVRDTFRWPLHGCNSAIIFLLPFQYCGQLIW